MGLCIPSTWGRCPGPQNSGLCRYTAEFKEEVVLGYLPGGGPGQFIAVKYGTHAESTVLKCAKQYNSHEELTDSRKTGGYLIAKDTKRRKTTLEERTRTVEYCISHANDYASAAKEFNCPNGQVYSWVKKYATDGMGGLRDGRGRNKTAEELSGVEKLRAENRLPRAEKKKQQTEISLLKNPERPRGGVPKKNKIS